MKADIRDLTLEELTEKITAMGEPPHRAGQIFRWLNRRDAPDFARMTDIPAKLAEELDKKFRIGHLECAQRLRSSDGAEKFLWRLCDGEHVESVFLPEGVRKSLCLSTQVGCRFKCPFCASGTMGFKRNLTASEMIGQVLEARGMCGCRITNIVFMGMGEPLDNFDNLEKAIRAINHPEGIGIGARKITVSTCGIIPGIRKMKDLGLQVELSVSLHAAYDDLRNELVPANRKYPLEELLSACREYYEDTGRVITLEYTLIKGKNDSSKDAALLAGIARELKAKVNLIGCNPYSERRHSAPAKEKVKKFRDRLVDKGVTATIRRSRGTDITAACGQLASRRRKQ